MKMSTVLTAIARGIVRTKRHQDAPMSGYDWIRALHDAAEWLGEHERNEEHERLTGYAGDKGGLSRGS